MQAGLATFKKNALTHNHSGQDLGLFYRILSPGELKLIQKIQRCVLFIL